MADVTDLKQYEIFHSFSDKQLFELASIAEEKAYGKRAHVYERGEPATHLFLVSKGLVSLRDIGPGDLIGISYETCDPGKLFGAASLVRAQGHPLTAVCLEDSQVMAIEAKRLFALCRNDTRLGYNLMFTVAQLYFDRYMYAKKQAYEMVKAPTIITALPG